MNIVNLSTPDACLAYWLNRRGEGIFGAVKSVTRIVSKQRAKAGKVAARKIKQSSSKSMMNMGSHPRPFHRVQGQLDERTRRLFAAHDRRQAAGWIRG